MTALPSPAGQLRLARGARAAVRAYAKLNPWLDPLDLEQEAAVVALEATSTWRSGGTSPDLWEAWKVGLALSQLVAEQLAPVTMPKKKGGAVQRATACRPVSMTVDRGGCKASVGECEHPAVAAVAIEFWEPIEDRIDLERAAARVRRILAEETEAARAVLLEEEKSAAVAERLGMRVRDVYAQTADAMRRLRAAFAGWELTQ